MGFYMLVTLYLFGLFLIIAVFLPCPVEAPPASVAARNGVAVPPLIGIVPVGKLIPAGAVSKPQHVATANKVHQLQQHAAHVAIGEIIANVR